MFFIQWFFLLVFFLHPFISLGYASDTVDSSHVITTGGYRTSTRSSFSSIPLTQPSLKKVPKKDDFSIFSKYNPVSSLRVDHSPYTDFMTTYAVDTPSLQPHQQIRYADITTADLKRLYDYLRYLSLFEVERLSKDEQIAFWINLYNAALIFEIASNRPIAKPDIFYGVDGFSGLVFSRKIITVARVRLSLNDIRDRILRPLFPNPLILFSLGCGTTACPPFPSMAVLPYQLDEDLSANVQRALLAQTLLWHKDDTLFIGRFLDFFPELQSKDAILFLDFMRPFLSAHTIDTASIQYVLTYKQAPTILENNPESNDQL